MKVLIDCTRLNLGGGIQVGLAVLANASDRAGGHEWHAVLSSNMARELAPAVANGLASVTCLCRSTNAVSQIGEAFRTLPRLEERLKPDVVFTVFGPTLWRANVPQLIGFALPSLIYPEVRAQLRHDTWWLNARRRLADCWSRVRLQRGSSWVVETETVKSRMTKVLGMPRERIFVVRNSYSPLFAGDTKSDSAVSDAASTGLKREVSDSRADLIQILVPSAYYSHKNLCIVPAVAKRLKEKLRQRFQFVFTLPHGGAGWRKVRGEAQELGVLENVVTVGAVRHDAIARLYETANMVFLPTLMECSTAVYPEAFVAGVPLATSDADFARELCLEGAEYFDPRDAGDAARAVQLILSDRAHRMTLVCKGREALRRNYPSPREKWASQLRCLEVLAAGGAADNICEVNNVQAEASAAKPSAVSSLPCRSDFRERS